MPAELNQKAARHSAGGQERWWPGLTSRSIPHTGLAEEMIALDGARAEYEKKRGRRAEEA